MCSRGTIKIRTIHQLALDIHLPRVSKAATTWRHPHPGSGEFKSGETIPMVVANHKGNGAYIDVARFGFAFEWADHLVTNAREDSIETKKTWSPMFYNSRCAIPLNGFWEWNKRMSCYTFFSLDPKATQVMYVAGIYGKTGTNGAKSLAMVTTGPNSQVAQVHNRMPVILGPKEVVQWVDCRPENRINRWQLKELLVPYKGELYSDDLIAA